ncbi:exonuclease domain-containing protein [Wenzhouxiangella sp. EGI_FJ10305]|uniref:exonuclease domain-containing protein n=1 Tax=Wenzhouxiangella sp. EGI_FJ10305 TaxID=3243768 RepID=UPI0035D716F4
MDVETTGLDPSNNEVIDLGAIYTDLEGNEMDRFFIRIQPEHPGRAAPAQALKDHSLGRWP